MTRDLKVGLLAGGGVPPGYIWSVWYLALARDDAMQFLDEGQYAHVVDQFRALASETNPGKPLTLRVDAIDDYWELKDKGGILGKINLRVYFTVIAEHRAIVVLAAIKKEAEGQTPAWVKIRVRNRLRRVLRGDLGTIK